MADRLAVPSACPPGIMLAPPSSHNIDHQSNPPSSSSPSLNRSNQNSLSQKQMMIVGGGHISE